MFEGKHLLQLKMLFFFLLWNKLNALLISNWKKNFSDFISKKVYPIRYLKISVCKEDSKLRQHLENSLVIVIGNFVWSLMGWITLLIVYSFVQ